MKMPSLVCLLATALILGACGASSPSSNLATTDSSTPLVVFSSVSLKADATSIFDDALPSIVAATRAEPGNIRYYPLVGTSAPGTRSFIEAWQSQDALNAHLQSQAVAEFFAITQSAFAAPPVVETYSPVADLDVRLASALQTRGAIVATVKLTVRDEGAASQFTTLAAQLNKLARAEPGNLAAEFARSTTSPLVFQGIVVFSDAQAFAAHASGPADALFREQGAGLLGSAPGFQVFSTLEY